MYKICNTSYGGNTLLEIAYTIRLTLAVSSKSPHFRVKEDVEKPASGLAGEIHNALSNAHRNE